MQSKGKYEKEITEVYVAKYVDAVIIEFADGSGILAHILIERPAEGLK